MASRRLSSVAAASTPTTELSQTSLGQVEPPPKSIYSIKTKGFDMKNAGAAVRQVGTTRRVFLLDPYLTTNEIEGLAYRLRVMSKNQGINSVLIATDDDDDVEFSAIPSSARESEQLYVPVVDMPELGSNAVKDDCHIWHVAGGYNPRDLFQSGDYKDPSAIQNIDGWYAELGIGDSW